MGTALHGVVVLHCVYTPCTVCHVNVNTTPKMVRISKPIYDALIPLAQADHRSVTSLVNKILADHLEQIEQNGTDK